MSSIEYWKTIDTIDDNGRTKVLQRKWRSVAPTPEAPPRERPLDEYRLASIQELVDDA